MDANNNNIGVHSRPFADTKVPLKAKLAFGAGDVGPAIVTIISGFFLLFFFTDVAGLSPALGGTILLLSKIWDAFNDPFVGALSDRIPTRWGRRRPWLLLGAVPFGLSFWLLFQVPPFGDTGKFWYYLLVSLLLDTAYTVVNVPYTALAAELSDDYDERTSLTSYRFVFSIAASLVAGVLHPIIVGAVVAGGGTQQEGYSISIGIWAVAATLPFVWAFWGTYERHAAPAEQQPRFRDNLRAVFANRAFRYVTGIYLLSWLVVQTVSTLIPYYTLYWLRRPIAFQGPLILAVQGSALAWLLIWSRASRRIGKQGVYYRGMVFMIAVLLLLFAVQPAWPDWLVLLLAALAGVGVATAYLVPWAMLPDVIEQDELLTGHRREGLYFGFVVLLQKLGLALGLFAVGQVLALTGYAAPPAGQEAGWQQPASTLLAVRTMIGPLPALLLLAGLYLVYRYPITREVHEHTLAQLAARRAQRGGIEN